MEVNNNGGAILVAASDKTPSRPFAQKQDEKQIASLRLLIHLAEASLKRHNSTITFSVPYYWSFIWFHGGFHVMVETRVPILTDELLFISHQPSTHNSQRCRWSPAAYRGCLAVSIERRTSVAAVCAVSRSVHIPLRCDSLDSSPPFCSWFIQQSLVSTISDVTVC